MKKISLLILFVIMGLRYCQISGKENRKVAHVLVIGIDGLGSHGFEIAHTPHMNRLNPNFTIYTELN